MTKRKKGRLVNGFFVLDKPPGLSSNIALQKVKRLFNAQKAGHCGSLDPLATGVLPICLGEATKFSGYLLDADKTYLTTARFGISTDTGDAEGSVIDTRAVTITEKDIQDVLAKFTGNIRQIPPMYSALKHKGQPLYKLARAGHEVERTPRNITIYELKLEDWKYPEATFRMHCSKGTYIRTLVEDIGTALGCGGHVTMLRRVKAGPFSLTQAHTLETLQQKADFEEPSTLDQELLPLDSALQDLPALFPEQTNSFHLQQGQPVQIACDYTSGLVRLYEQENKRFIGLGTVQPDGKIAPKRLISSQV